MSSRKGADLGIAAGATAALNYRGAFSSIVTYAVNDVVTYAGSLYRNKTAIAQTPIAAPLTAHYEVAPTSTTYNLVLPAGINAGDLIMVASTCNTSPMTMPAGWTAYSQVGAGAYSITGTVFTKVATSTDAGSTVVVGVQEQQGIVVRSYTTAGLDTNAGAASSTTPSLTPTVFPSKIVSFFGSVVVAATAPAGVSNAYSQNRSSGDARATLGCDEVITGGSSTPRTAGAVTNSNAGVDTLAFALKPVQPSGAFDVTKWDQIGVLANDGTLDTTATHHKGAWDSTKTYAVNDVVTQAYGLYVALTASSNTDPTSAVGLTTTVNVTNGTGSTSGNGGTFTQGFTTSAPILLDTLTANTAGIAGNSSQFRLFISDTVGGVAKVINGVTLSSTVTPTATGRFDAPLTAQVTLPAGTYYFNSAETGSGGGGGNHVVGRSVTPAATGATLLAQSYVNNSPYQTTAALDFALKYRAVAWQKLANLGADPANAQPDTTATHYKGAWDSTKTYAVNDVVSRSYGLYAALQAVPAAADPTSGATSVLGGNIPAATTYNNASSYWTFTVNAVTNVSQIDVAAFQGGGQSTASSAAYIADSAGVVLAQGALGHAGSTAGGYDSYVLGATATLQPGVTYRVGVLNAGNYGVTNNATSLSGVVASMAADGGGYRLVFRLVGPASYWQKIANTREAVVVAKTAAYTMVDPDTVVLANGTFTVTLPVASAANVGKRYTVKNTGTGTVTIAPQGAATIDGAANTTITLQYDGLDFANDGTNWFRV